MCNYCRYGRYGSDDRPCCEECYLNRKSQIVFFKDLYRKCDFLCEVCIKFYYDKKWQQMLGISKIVSIEEYNATNKLYCNKCELYEWNHIISFKGGDKHLLCNGCIRFFKDTKYKRMIGVRNIERVR